LKEFSSIDQQLSLSFDIGKNDCASFDGQNVHPVYATFALGRDAEWTCRQFVLQLMEEDEEGIGTQLTINHHSPALLGSKVIITAKIDSLTKNELICSYIVKVNDRLIAEGITGQKIIKKEKINQLFQAIKNEQ